MKKTHRKSGHPAFKWATMAFVVLVLSGCVVGQELDISYDPPEAISVADGTPINVSVIDVRPYVTSGEKAPYYIGKYRAGFGIPYDVSTDGDRPLAELLERDLRKELASLGFRALSGTESLTTLRVSIKDWIFDTYVDGIFKYTLLVEVLRGANVVASKDSTDAVNVQGSMWTGGKGAFEKAMPDLYKGAIESVIQDSPEILEALQQE